MKIEIVELRDIKPYYNNPRDNSNAVQPVIESIKRYGFVKPILCDRDGVIIVGHTRYIASFQMGLDKVPVVYSDMDDENAKLFRIADNKLAEKSEYDDEALIEELKKLEVPESLQAFFFEDIKEMINFSFKDFQVNTESDYGFDMGTQNEYEGDSSENYFEGSTGEENYEIGEDKHDDEPTPAEKDSEYNDLYKVRIVEGKKLMKVVCPYCGNIETIEVE